MTVTMQITTPYSPDEQEFLSDIITAAVEGGVNYWARTSEYQWANLDLKPGHPDWFATTVKLHDVEDPEEHPDPLVVNIDVVARGMNAWLTNHPATILAKSISDAIREVDAGEIDAYDADQIVQAGLWGESIYG